jgi:hypothetical protein
MCSFPELSKKEHLNRDFSYNLEENYTYPPPPANSSVEQLTQSIEARERKIIRHNMYIQQWQR